MASSRTPTIDPFTLYHVPSGFIGLINDLISIYIFTCLLSGRTPLQPNRKLQNRHRTTMILYLSFATTEVLNFMIFRSLEHVNGPWQELYCIMAAKMGMMPLCGFMVTAAAVRELKAPGRVKPAAVGKRVMEEEGLEVGRIRGDKNDRYQVATAKGYDDSHASKSSEIPDLSSKGDCMADAKAIEKVEIKLLGLAMEAQRESSPPGYTTGAQLDTEGCSVDLESQQSDTQELKKDEANEKLLPSEANTTGVHAQDQYSYSSGLFIFLMAVLSTIPAGFLWAQISMAIQSINLGNRDTLVVGFIFLVLFFAGVVPYAVVIAYTAMRRARLTPGSAPKVESLIVVPILVSSLLVILYGDMNIGAISGHLAGMGPMTDRNAMIRYWMYLLSSKLLLFCH